MSTEKSIISQIISCDLSGRLLAPMTRPVTRLVKRPESPQDYFNRIITEKGLSHVKVADRAKALGYKLSAGYVHNIARGTAENPSIQLAEALAAGIGRPAEEVINVFRGKSLTDEIDYKESLFAVMWKEYSKLSNADQKELRVLIDTLQQTIERRFNP